MEFTMIYILYAVVTGKLQLALEVETIHQIVIFQVATQPTNFMTRHTYVTI